MKEELSEVEQAEGGMYKQKYPPKVQIMNIMKCRVLKKKAIYPFKSSNIFSLE